MTAQRCPRGAPRQQTNVSIPETMTLQKFREISRKIEIFRETSYSLPPRCRVITSKPPSRATSSARKSLTQESRGVRDAFRASTQSQKD